MNKGEIDKLLTITEAAEKLGVSKLTLRNWDNNGILKAVRLGSRGDRRYRERDLDAFFSPKDHSAQIDRAALDTFLKTQTLWTEQLAGALPITLETGVNRMVDMNTYFPPGISHCIFLYDTDGVLSQYLSEEESIEACKAHVAVLHAKPESIKDFFADCHTQFSRFDECITRANFLQLDKLSNAELNKEFASFESALSRFWIPTLVVEPYAPYVDHYYLPQFEKEVGNVKKAREAFIKLSIPAELSFVSQERRDLLTIILRYAKSKAARVKLSASSDADYLAYLAVEEPDFLAALRRHVEHYFWIQNSYSGWNVLTIYDFLGFIRSILKEQSTGMLERELALLTNQKAQRKEQEMLEKKLGLSEKTRKELAFLRKVVWIKDERKKHVLKMLHPMYLFLEEYSKRTGIPTRLLAFAHVDEMPRILNKEIGPETLEPRTAGMVHISQRGGAHSFLIGNEFHTVRESLVKPHSANSEESLHGTIACKGPESVVYGTVKVILDPRDQTIGDEEILVTSMTRPEFIPLMRKAKAVITDEGGITCHAAIVSREMNKPCFIGTRVATKVLRTGEKVEMRMNHGIVRPSPYK